MASFGERVASVALAKFEALPAKSKPRVHPNGKREWVPMSAIILACDATSEEETLTCVSLATGTKCLPVSLVVKCHGNVLHDSHAEILALRGLNHFLISEVKILLELPAYVSPYIQRRTSPTRCPEEFRPFEVRPNVTTHLFSTEAPCGDASMDLLIKTKSKVLSSNAVPWPEPHVSSSNHPQLHGRGYFSSLGAVRRKPCRADAEPTLSKSCTDKIALKQLISVLSFPASLFIARTRGVYLASIILPLGKYSKEGFTRAFDSERGLSQAAQQPHQSTYRERHLFETILLPSTFTRFAFDRPDPIRGEAPAKAGNVSALWIRGMHEDGRSTNETLVKGVKQGIGQFSESKLKRSAVCRRRMWERGREVAKLLRGRAEDMVLEPDMLKLLDETLWSQSYEAAKTGLLSSSRNGVKIHEMATLDGWARNLGDEKWNLDERIDK